MHKEALDWLRSVKPLVANRVWIADFGSFNVNGSAREIFEADADLYVGVDTRDGPGVDVVDDAAWWLGTTEPFDLILCTECLEHTPYAAAIVYNAYRLLKSGGVFLATMAGPARTPHSVDGDLDLAGEFYKNVAEADLREWLRPFAVVLTQNRDGVDIYALAVKGEQP